MKPVMDSAAACTQERQLQKRGAKATCDCELSHGKELLGRMRHQTLYAADYIGDMTDHTKASDRTLYVVYLFFALKWLSPTAQALVPLLWP